MRVRFRKPKYAAAIICRLRYHVAYGCSDQWRKRFQAGAKAIMATSVETFMTR